MAEDTEYQRSSQSLGLERWVQFAFVAIAVVTILLAHNLVLTLWNDGIVRWVSDGFHTVLPEVGSTAAAAIGAFIGVLTGYRLYANEKINAMAHEVAEELSKVTWPSREETWHSTVVVIVTSLIAAVYLGAFDAVWSWFTDLIYSA